MFIQWGRGCMFRRFATKLSAERSGHTRTTGNKMRDWTAGDSLSSRGGKTQGGCLPWSRSVWAVNSGAVSMPFGIENKLRMGGGRRGRKRDRQGGELLNRYHRCWPQIPFRS